MFQVDTSTSFRSDHLRHARMVHIDSETVSSLSPVVGVEQEKDGSPIIGIIVMGVILFVVCSVIIKGIFCARRPVQEPPKEKKKRLVRSKRYEQAERWLVTRKALSVDQFCQPCDEDIITECCICLEDIEAGDLVSWPSQASCRHAISHHHCLKEALVKREGCPFCRSPVLVCDQEGFTEDQDETTLEEEFQRQLQEQAKAGHFLRYCAIHGLESIPDDIESTSFRRMMESCCPSNEELQACRGLSAKSVEETEKSDRARTASEVSSTATIASEVTAEVDLEAADR